MKYKTYILFGPPGSGKGTQGKTLGSIPRFYHCPCGDVFRSIDTRTKVGKAFLEYSSKGQLVPDEITVELWPTSTVFRRGHRLRLEVSSSNHPRFDRHPNTGRPVATEAEPVAATQTVYHDRGRPSRLVLPVIPAE